MRRVKWDLSMVSPTSSLMVLLMLSAIGGHVSGQGSQSSNREVIFPGHELRLAGNLLLPARRTGSTRFPAAVIIGEMGISTRDGLMVGPAAHPVYRDLAEALALRGVATLRFDLRCRGVSECRRISAYDDYIDDLQGAIRFLSAQPEIDPKRIVLIGHGEGGLIASSLLAQFENGAAGLVTLSMSGRSLGKMLRDDLQVRMSEEGRPLTEIREMQAKAERITRALFYSRPELIKDTFDPSNPHDLKLRAILDEVPRSVSLLVNDPLQTFAAVRVPILIIQGEKDLEVTNKDAAFLEESLKRTFHPDHTLKLLPEMDHLLKINKGQPSFASYSDVTRPVDPQLFSIIGDWVTARFGQVTGTPKKGTLKK